MKRQRQEQKTKQLIQLSYDQEPRQFHQPSVFRIMTLKPPEIAPDNPALLPN